MIVPRDPLLLVFAAALLPASVFAPVWVTVAIAATLAIVAAGDALLGMRAAAGVSVRVPAIVRMIQTRPAEIAVVVQSPGSVLVRTALRVPEAVRIQPLEAMIPSDAQPSRFAFTGESKIRGSFSVDLAAVGVTSPLRFWEARRQLPVSTELRVYPDLRAAQRSLAPLLTRSLQGVHVNRQVGRGREFEKLREYLPGDPMGDVHWKATARRAKPVTRVYQIERTQEIYAVLDSSRLTARPAGEGTILDRYVATALALNLVSRQQGDLFGLVTFSDSVHSFLRAGSGPGHYDSCRNALLAVKTRLVAPDYRELFSAMQSRLRRRALLVFLTELDDPVLAEDFQGGVTALTRRHLVAAASVQDVSSAPLFTVPVSNTEEIYERLAGHMAWRRLEELRVRLRAAGIRFSVVEPSRLGLEMARMYLNVKRRQVL